MTIAAARAELVAKLQTISDISGRSYSFAPDSLVPPAAFVGTMTYDPRATFADADLTVQVWAVLSKASSSTRAAELLDAYIDGGSSVVDALQAASAVWDSLAVTGVEFPITVTVGAGEFVAARFDCEVFL